jgi:hypothetical protein
MRFKFFLWNSCRLGRQEGSSFQNEMSSSRTVTSGQKVQQPFMKQQCFMAQCIHPYFLSHKSGNNILETINNVDEDT